MFDTVAADLEQDLAFSTTWKRDLPATDSLSGTIDPTLLLLDFSEILLYDVPSSQNALQDAIGAPTDMSTPSVSADVFAARPKGRISRTDSIAAV
ncbi:hypothetical protein N0V84_004769 [Fusarium piperis]|uniref:Uncharacterized protein n=1 Tax=Fusarium piperis TaxID=1435070 RepID=A0A9W8WEZ1_9HYPO|nr:hypothetical protein N0V84_004769 [Fusarium piperis]